MKLTPALKQRITRDWLSHFPNLGIYKRMRLLRRVGPLLSGICLSRNSGNDAYDPIFHVHSLARPFPTVSLTLAESLLSKKTRSPRSIQAAFHDQIYAEAAEQLKQQALIPLSGDVSLAQAVNAYLDYMKRPIATYSIFLYEDVLALLLWCRHIAEARKYLGQFEKEMRSWPNSVRILQEVGGIKAWVSRCHYLVDNPQIVHATVAEQLKVLKAEHLPEDKCIC